MVIHKSGALDISLGICLLLLSWTATAAEKLLDRSFPVSAGGHLTVDAQACDIAVRGSDSDQAVIHIAIYGAEGQLEQYTRMARDESMRLYPPVWLTERKPFKDDALCNYHIPAGITIGITQYVTHRHPEFWDDPETFDPERFSPERSKGRHEYAYFPFSGGARQCLGKHLALLETEIVLAMLLQRFRIELKPGWQVIKEPEISLRLKGGLWMLVKPA